MSTAAWPEWEVTKLDAARRQLGTAIRLLFSADDAVSIHTLAHAAFGVLKGVSEHQGERRILDAAEAEALATPEKINEYWKRFNQTGNFFKHADKDPEGFLDGRPEEESEALISLAIEMYKDLNGIETPEIKAFSLWWRCIHFQGIEDVREPFISWLSSNAHRLHSDERSELLAIGYELWQVLLKDESRSAQRGG